MRSFLTHLFRPATLRADTIEALRARGLTHDEADHAWSAIRFSSRTGAPLPPYVRELLERSVPQ